MTGISPDTAHICSLRRTQRCSCCQSQGKLQDSPGSRRSIPLYFPVPVGHSRLHQLTPTKAAQSPHLAPALPFWEGHLSPSCPQAISSTQGGRARGAAQPGACWTCLSHGAVAEAALLTALLLLCSATLEIWKMVLTMPESSEKILDELCSVLHDKQPRRITTMGLGFLRLTVSYWTRHHAVLQGSLCSAPCLPLPPPQAGNLGQGRAGAELGLWLRQGRSTASAQTE